MKTILIILLFLIPLTGFSQKKKVTLSGTIQIISYHQGGAMMPEEYYSPRPYATKLYVVKYIDSIQVLEVVDSLQSNGDGGFEIKLKPGKYGFVTSAEKNNLKPGQFLPTAHYTGDEYTSSSSSWTANMPVPIEIKDSPVNGLILTYSNTSVCFMCP